MDARDLAYYRSRGVRPSSDVRQTAKTTDVQVIAAGALVSVVQHRAPATVPHELVLAVRKIPETAPPQPVGSLVATQGVWDDANDRPAGLVWKLSWGVGDVTAECYFNAGNGVRLALPSASFYELSLINLTAAEVGVSVRVRASIAPGYGGQRPWLLSSQQAIAAGGNFVFKFPPFARRVRVMWEAGGFFNAFPWMEWRDAAAIVLEEIFFNTGVTKTPTSGTDLWFDHHPCAFDLRVRNAGAGAGRFQLIHELGF